MTDKHLPRVDVLMATYNGARFLSEQIESILGQIDVDIRLVIRDDGSQDGTVDILSTYAERFPGKVLVVSDSLGRLGVTMNFLHLLTLESQADYFALSDQDDVWLQDKIRSGIDTMRGSEERPLLYFTAVEFVSEDLRHIGTSLQTIVPSFESALIEGAMAGCTAVMNARMRRLVAERLPSAPAMHDWWIYLVACTLGRVFFDPAPRIKYRQHGQNLIGGGRSAAQKWKRHLQRALLGGYWPIAAQAGELKRLFGPRLAQDQLDLVNALVAGKRSLATRLGLALNRRLRAQSVVGTIGVKLMILANKY